MVATMYTAPDKGGWWKRIESDLRPYTFFRLLLCLLTVPHMSYTVLDKQS